jgi:hypothetical protein
MFIKFGDSTQKLVVKTSKEKNENTKFIESEKSLEEGNDYGILYMDENSEDRRVKTLLDYEKEK